MTHTPQNNSLNVLPPIHSFFVPPSSHPEERWLVFPKNTAKNAWDGFIAILIMYSILVIPMDLAFDTFSTGSRGTIIVGIEYALNILFVGDIVLSFNTAYYAGN